MRGQRLRAWFQAGGVLLALLGAMPAGSAAEKTSADALWDQIETLVSTGREAGQTAAEGRLPPLTPAQLQRLRDLALEFLEGHPADSRTPDLRRALLAHDMPDPLEPFARIFRSRDQDKKLRAAGYFDLDLKAAALLQLAAGPGAADEEKIIDQFHWLRVVIDRVKPGLAWERDLQVKLSRSPSQALRKLAEGYGRYLALAEQPLSLRGMALTGGADVDLEQFRDKVVLVDVWGLLCSSCIAAMPRLQALYEKYRDRGFEVVGLCLITTDDPDLQARQMARAREVSHAQGVTWTEAVISGLDEVSAFMDNLSLRGTPQIFLLDRQGRLAMKVKLFDDLYGPRAGQSPLEREIERLLQAGR